MDGWALANTLQKSHESFDAVDTPIGVRAETKDKLPSSHSLSTYGYLGTVLCRCVCTYDMTYSTWVSICTYDMNACRLLLISFAQMTPVSTGISSYVHPSYSRRSGSRAYLSVLFLIITHHWTLDAESIEASWI